MSFDRRLGRVFGFDADDLEANRQGRLSAEQSRMFAVVADMNRRRGRWVVPLIVVMLGVAAVLTVVSTPGEGNDEVVGPLVGIGVTGAFILGLVAFFRRRTVGDTRVHEAGQVLGAQGPFEYDPTWDGTWGVEIGGVRFLVELLQYQALDDHAVYRAYFLATQPHPTLLSIERADG